MNLHTDPAIGGYATVSSVTDGDRLQLPYGGEPLGVTELLGPFPPV